MKKNSQRNVLIVPLIITFIIAVAALASTLVFAVRFSSDTQNLSSQISDLQIQNSRLRFCYDNQIKSCDDASITAWNTAHPDDAFNLKAQ